MYRDREPEIEPVIPLPPKEPRNPFETLLLLWIALASLSFAAGDPGSKLLEEALPERTVILWGAAAMIGSVTALAGVVMTRWTRDGLVLERTGLILVGGAALVYGLVVYGSAAHVEDVRYITGVQMGLALACGWRAVHITKRLRWARSVRAEGG